MDYKELQEENNKLKSQIETFHLFYQDFNKYDLAISKANATLVQMLSDVVGIKKKGNKTDKVIEQEKKIISLLDVFEDMQGLNNKCQSQKILIKHKGQNEMYLKDKIEVLTKELESIKKAFDG